MRSRIWTKYLYHWFHSSTKLPVVAAAKIHTSVTDIRTVSMSPVITSMFWRQMIAETKERMMVTGMLSGRRCGRMTATKMLNAASMMMRMTDMGVARAGWCERPHTKHETEPKMGWSSAMRLIQGGLMTSMTPDHFWAYGPT